MTDKLPKIMCDDHKNEKLEVFERTPGVFSVQLCECCMSEEQAAGWVDAEMEHKVGDYEEESTDEPPNEPGNYDLTIRVTIIENTKSRIHQPGLWVHFPQGLLSANLDSIREGQWSDSIKEST